MISEEGILRAGILVLGICFFGCGLSYTLIMFVVTLIRKTKKPTKYYLMSFLISGVACTVLFVLLSLGWLATLN